MCIDDPKSTTSTPYSMACAVFDSIDLKTAPISVKLRAVEMLIQLERLSPRNNTGVESHSKKAQVSNKADPVRQWLDKCRGRGEIAGFPVFDAPVRIPRTLVYKDYCEFIKLLGSKPVSPTSFGLRLLDLPEFDTTVRATMTFNGRRVNAYEFNFHQPQKNHESPGETK